MVMIETITMIYNEEFLLPYYINHYGTFVDRFNFIVDEDSTDKTYDIVSRCPKANVSFIKLPDGMDDRLRECALNECYRQLKDCWVINVDADEFVFMGEELPESPTNTIWFYNVYRHRNDNDLSPNIPVRMQRRHGYLDRRYKKPVLVRSGLGITWSTGRHSIADGRVSPFYAIGAHWANADPCFCVKRRLHDRCERQSRNNLIHGITYQHHNLTEETILSQCKEHENDLEVF
jgi:hypothetical protein